MSLYKSQSHVRKYCQSQLYTDVEKNPGPNVVPCKIFKEIMQTPKEFQAKQ